MEQEPMKRESTFMFQFLCNLDLILRTPLQISVYEFYIHKPPKKCRKFSATFT